MTILNNIDNLLNLINETYEDRHQYKDNMKIGIMVDVVEKQNQKKSPPILTRGSVKRVLSPGFRHTQGIKVMLGDGTIGRVQSIIEDDLKNKYQNKMGAKRATHSYRSVSKSNDDEDPNADWYDDLKFN
jgi:uncharacterized repeat protein (TIGR03833 family)